MTGIITVNKSTYTAHQIKAMCQNMELDYDGFKILAELIDEEIELYPAEDIPVLMMASMIAFSRSLLKLSLKNLK